MTRLFPYQPSFTGGEIAPSLYGRMDIEKYSSALKRCENWIIHPHGGVSKRHGLRFAARAKYDDRPARLVDFQYNLEQSYILEFGDCYVRFYRNGAQVMSGGVPYEVVTPYVAADLPGLSFTQSADVLFIVHKGYKPYRLTRIADASWTIAPFVFKNGPFVAPKEERADIALKLSGLSGRAVLSASAPFFKGGHIGALFGLRHHVDEVTVKSSGDAGGTYVSSYVVGDSEEYEAGEQTHTRRFFVVTEAEEAKFVAGRRVKFGETLATVASVISGRVTFTPPPAWSAGVISCAVFMPSSMDEWSKEITVYSEWRLESGGFWGGTVVLEYWDDDVSDWIKYKSYSSQAYPDGTESGCGSAKNYADQNTVDEPTCFRLRAESFTTFLPAGNVEQDRGYFQLTATAADHLAVARVVSVSSSMSALVDLETAAASTRATKNWLEGAWSDANGWPSSVGFYQERIVFGGSPSYPQTAWLSKVGDYGDFGLSSPVVDDDAVTVPLVSRKVSGIRFFISLNKLISLTSDAEWLIGGSPTSDAISPTNVSPSVQGYRGCADVEPVVVGDVILYVQSQGSHVRDLGYEFASDSYTGADLTLLSNHLFMGVQIKEWCYQQEPDSMVWAVLSDGSLVSLTYMRDQNVVAWSRHPLAEGAVCESVSCVKTPHGDVVYFVVKRNGVRTVEEMRSVPVTTPAEAFYVDGGVTVRGNNISSVSGLDHLEGFTVTGLADGNVCRDMKVTGGSVVLEHPASVVHVGLAYTSEFETLDLNMASRDGTVMGRKSLRITGAIVRTEASRGIFAGVRGDALEEYKDRSDEVYGEPTRLLTKDMHFSFRSRYDDGRMVVSAPYPLPASVLAVVPIVDKADARS